MLKRSQKFESSLLRGCRPARRWQAAPRRRLRQGGGRRQVQKRSQISAREPECVTARFGKNSPRIFLPDDYNLGGFNSNTRNLYVYVDFFGQFLGGGMLEIQPGPERPSSGGFNYDVFNFFPRCPPGFSGVPYERETQCHWGGDLTKDVRWYEIVKLPFGLESVMSGVKFKVSQPHCSHFVL